MPAVIRLVHPAPAAAVIALSAALALILGAQTGSPAMGRIVLIVLAVTGSQVATGAINDWADRDRDLAARPEKPLPSGQLTPATALGVAAVGVGIQLAASVPLGSWATLAGLVALASALAYDLWLSRTPFSLLPYLVSFGILPVWVALGVGVPVGRVLPVVPLVAPFATAAHLANTLRDWDADAAGGSRSLAQMLGRPQSWALAVALATCVALIVAGVFLVSGRLSPVSAVLGLAGLAAILYGARSQTSLWYGMLVAAVCWTAGWALATG